MTTTPTESDVAAPAGATRVDSFYGDDNRCFWHPDIRLDDAVVAMGGYQDRDGSTSRFIWLDAAQQELSVKQARRLAAMLQNLADTCEILDGVER